MPSTLLLQALRWGEMLLLFVAIPLTYALGFRHIPLFVVILTAFALSIFLLLSDKSFDRKSLYKIHYAGWKIIWITWLAVTLVTAICVYIFLPDKWLIIVKTRPSLWLLIVVFYPIWSAYPQEVMYRAMFFHRYASIIPYPNVLWFLNGVLFALGHWVFNNPIAIGVTFVGGLFLAYRYHKSGSAMVTAIEHGLYGNLIYTVGLGEYFYNV